MKTYAIGCAILILMAGFVSVAFANGDDWKAPPPLAKAPRTYVIVDWPTGRWQMEVSPEILDAAGLRHRQTISAEKAFELDEFRKKQLR